MSDKKQFRTYAEELWYKFVVYVQITLIELSSLAGGIALVTGLNYADRADDIYAVYPKLQTLDITFGIVMFLITAFAVLVHIQTAGLKKSAPIMFYVLAGLNLSANIIYPAAAGGIAGNSAFNAVVITSVILTALLLAADIVFFIRNKDCFINR